MAGLKYCIVPMLTQCLNFKLFDLGNIGNLTAITVL